VGSKEQLLSMLTGILPNVKLEDNSSENAKVDSDEIYLNELNIPTQVTEGAAVKVTYDGKSDSESKSFWDYFVEAEMLQEKSNELERQGNEQLVNINLLN